MKKPIPVGYDSFQDLITRNCYYVDKTRLIKELIDTEAKVVLFTRPRRFGKTLNQTMLKCFFEKTKEDNSSLFEGLEIAGYDGKYMSEQGKYPVIFVSFKGLKQDDYVQAFNSFKNLVVMEMDRHNEILKSDKLSDVCKARFQKIVGYEGTDADYMEGLGFLSNCLQQVYGENVIAIIDEYDVPLENAHFKGFYSEMVTLVRNAFENLLKTNESLHMAVLTGCLRVSKESIFTGLNNLDIYDVTHEPYSQYFGFTVDEVKAMLEYYDRLDIYDTIKSWYDGYIFGITEIYNPYSLTKALKMAVQSSSFTPEAFWSNTSSNSIVNDVVAHCNDSTRDFLEQLTMGLTIVKPIYKDLTYGDIGNSEEFETVNSDQIWSHLLFTGYLKQKPTKENGVYQLRIPNHEIMKTYTKIIENAFKTKLKTTSRDAFFKAVLNGDAKAIELTFKQWIYRAISYHDNKEDFYHGVMLGLLSGFDGYKVKSNRESGDGRFDIIVYDAMTQSIGIIFEFKFAETIKEMDAKCDEGLAQIEKLHYEEELLDLGIDNIIKYGAAFYKKMCKVKCGNSTT